MPDPIPLHARKARGPEHPPPPPPTDPRLQPFPRLPGEDGAAWARHAGEVLDGLAPIDGLERKLAAAVAVAVGMWRECRADRIEAEVLADIAPHGEGRGHGSDLQEPAHVAALTAALRCRTAASIATGRPAQGQGHRIARPHGRWRRRHRRRRIAHVRTRRPAAHARTRHLVVHV